MSDYAGIMLTEVALVNWGKPEK